MADHGAIVQTTATGNDYAQHEQTYRSFVRLAKYAVAAAAIVVALMAYFLV